MLSPLRTLQSVTSDNTQGETTQSNTRCSSKTHTLHCKLHTQHDTCYTLESTLYTSHSTPFQQLRTTSISESTTSLAQSTSQYHEYFALQKHLSGLLCLHCKDCTKYFPALLSATKLAQSTSQYYFAPQPLHNVLPSLTRT